MWMFGFQIGTFAIIAKYWAFPFKNWQLFSWYFKSSTGYIQPWYWPGTYTIVWEGKEWLKKLPLIGSVSPGYCQWVLIIRITFGISPLWRPPPLSLTGSIPCGSCWPIIHFLSQRLHSYAYKKSSNKGKWWKYNNWDISPNDPLYCGYNCFEHPIEYENPGLSYYY